jgi:hypothetical protein
VTLKLELPAPATAELVLQALGVWGTHICLAILLCSVLKAITSLPFPALQLAAKVVGGKKKNQNAWRHWLEMQIKSGKLTMNDSSSSTSGWPADQLELGTSPPLSCFPF